MRRTLAVVIAAAAVGCVAPVPPAPPVPRAAAEVAAGFSKVWDATIDVFADKNIAIRTLDKASGLIVAEPMKVRRGDALEYADCGTNILGEQMPATDATWNLLVRGDSTHATVKATVRFQMISTGTYGSTADCSTHGVWETDTEKAIKARAEAKK